MNFYNENNPFAASWLRELIKYGAIAPGIVDERSIEDIKPKELIEYTQCHFFAGIGIWSYALRCAGWPDDRKVWTGSCPCQPFSAAGKRKGTSDERHLWPAWFWLIQQSKPDTIFGEQVATKSARAWFDSVSDDLEGVGYTIGAAITTACGFGAPHIRKRIYFSASNTNCPRLPQRYESTKFRAPAVTSAWREFERIHAASAWKEREAQSIIPVFTDGVASRVERTRAFGNAIVAPQAQGFIEAYLESE